jgi:prepilin-type N-terminal cleavage/methylation domain-containing protein
MKNIFNIRKNNKKQQKQKGFTLVELITVVSIISVISTLALFNSSKLNSAVLLSNTVYEVDLIVRDAQVAGLGARVMSVTGESGIATTSNQGMYFNILEPEQIILFADFNNNNKYDQGEDSQVYNIENKRAGKILGFCEMNEESTCSQEKNSLSVIFKRPNPEAYFYFNTGLFDYKGNIVVNIGFEGGDCRSMIIYKTGAIQIDKSFCPTN